MDEKVKRHEWRRISKEDILGSKPMLIVWGIVLTLVIVLVLGLVVSLLILFFGALVFMGDSFGAVDTVMKIRIGIATVLWVGLWLGMIALASEIASS